MQYKLDQSLSEALQKLQLVSERSKYILMISSLQFRYNRHADLEREIIAKTFLNKDEVYQKFVSGKLSCEKAKTIRLQIESFLNSSACTSLNKKG